jgi:hypothetical protein
MKENHYSHFTSIPCHRFRAGKGTRPHSIRVLRLTPVPVLIVQARTSSRAVDFAPADALYPEAVDTRSSDLSIIPARSTEDDVRPVYPGVTAVLARRFAPAVWPSLTLRGCHCFFLGHVSLYGAFLKSICFYDYRCSFNTVGKNHSCA